ncbi:hypothetical protein AGMMS49929_10770 [Endomicrobiia bacterium]|nr:hypothetical protein AGMMS49929_10770 [Endomicrobiia bacterium]GHT29077.1 hypothetical protein AGMMS49995_10950 [Endomicrobiia bacterium]
MKKIIMFLCLCIGCAGCSEPLISESLIVGFDPADSETIRKQFPMPETAFQERRSLVRLRRLIVILCILILK